MIEKIPYSQIANISTWNSKVNQKRKWIVKLANKNFAMQSMRLGLGKHWSVFKEPNVLPMQSQ